MMKKLLKNIAAAAFLMLFLPYTMTLLMNGKEGVHQEEALPELEYQVLHRLMQEDHSWMEDGALDLMAILYRTECAREPGQTERMAQGLPVEAYDRLYQAVVRTRGQTVVIDGEFRALPYHMISAGATRDGALLGEGYRHLPAMECPRDLEADDYLVVCYLTEEELKEALGPTFDPERMSVERDGSDYVTRVSCPGGEWPGEQFCALLHLPSSCFWMEPSGKSVRITVKGNGHGFGISLYTANDMIRGGANAAEVIQMFYPGAECITIPESGKNNNQR